MDWARIAQNLGKNATFLFFPKMKGGAAIGRHNYNLINISMLLK
jgi:hypothetical protein